MKTHSYAVTLRWTGNLGTGNATYRGYARDHEISGDGKATIAGSSDPAFRGDPSRWNPEELFIASVAGCHKLWYLHLCLDAGIVVEDYVDYATGEMAEHPDGSGEITSVMLRPEVTISAESDAELAAAIHGKVGAICFIARSVKCEIHHEPVIRKSGA